jgi:hypothetical protein
MKVGIIISTDDRETCFLAVRYATFHLVEHKDVKIYFIDAGLQYGKNDDGKYNLHKLLDDFKQSGGEFYKNRNHVTLKNRLLNQFRDLIHSRQIEDICDNDKFQSIMTRDVYIRKFVGNRI